MISQIQKARNITEEHYLASFWLIWENQKHFGKMAYYGLFCWLKIFCAPPLLHLRIYNVYFA